MTDAQSLLPAGQGLGDTLESAPPRIDEATATALVQRHYGIRATATAFACERDATFRLTAASECSSSTASRTRMPLRLTRSKSTKQSLVFSTATLLKLNLKLNLQRMSVKSMSLHIN